MVSKPSRRKAHLPLLPRLYIVLETRISTRKNRQRTKKTKQSAEYNIDMLIRPQPNDFR